ncbi:hypothetical protein ACIQYS_20325 [Psychrobacillus sp. NPDC096426]|uniref:hypothetical protein n=1 Tax=Psychrobacillus sp. NPDC096426 TaxID=3364491 RepID=UPI0038001104
MKKGLLMFLIVVIVSTLLVGCSTGKQNEDNSFANNFEKTQKIEIISSDDSDIITTISDNKDIENFVDALIMDDWDWEPVDLPSEAITGKTFKIYRKDAAKISWSKKQKDNLNEVATMTTYKNVPYIKLSLKNFSFNFKVPEEVHEYLNSIEM